VPGPRGGRVSPTQKKTLAPPPPPPPPHHHRQPDRHLHRHHGRRREVDPSPTASPTDIPHPGFLWLDEAACGDLDESDEVAGSALSLFFVDAGHVISEET
jgi:hypothetical protein